MVLKCLNLKFNHIALDTLKTCWVQSCQLWKRRAKKKGLLDGFDLEIDQVGDFVSVIVLIPLPPPLETRIRI